MKVTKTEVTVDIVVEQTGKILLIKRGQDPFKGLWALPGGFVETHERVKTAAARELKEETSLDLSEDELEFIDFFDDPDRDPRGRLISFAHGVALNDHANVKAGDDAGEAEWFNWEEIPDLAFDHHDILEQWKQRDTQ